MGIFEIMGTIILWLSNNGISIPLPNGESFTCSFLTFIVASLVIDLSIWFLFNLLGGE